MTSQGAGGNPPSTGGGTGNPGGGAKAYGGATGSQGGSPVGGNPNQQGGSDTGTGGTTSAEGGGTGGGTTPTTAGGTTAENGGAGGSSQGGTTGGDGLGGFTSTAGGTSAGGTTESEGGSDQGGQTATGGISNVGGSIPREQGEYPEADPADCGAWRLVDNVCCAQYCSDDNTTESCTACGGVESETCVAVHSKACKSGLWPEVGEVTDDEPWHYSRSTHFGLTAAGACAYGLYSLCNTTATFDSDLKERCEVFCTAYPDLCADPEGTTLRGNYAAPQGNYYTQFWPSLPGDRDNYLACGECFELVRTKKDGTDYAVGEEGYTPPITLQIVDSCPCAANSKWCCGSGRDHCGEISDFGYGCPLPPGPPDPPADHNPLPNESIHLDLSDFAMARLQTGDPNGSMVDGVVPTRYRRVPCPVVGNTYIWLHPSGGEYWFSVSVVNSAGLGSVTVVEAQLPSGEWVALERDSNFTSSRPQERYGAWVLPQGVGPFELPITMRFTAGGGQTIVATDVIKSFTPADPAMEETYYIDTGVQF